MNKTELVKVIAEKTGYTQKDSKVVLEAVVDTIVETVAAGEEVAISGLGKFVVTERAAREGVNPATGQPLHIEASKAPKFKAAAPFKAAVKGN